MSDPVYVVTDLGPTDGPGLVVPTELLGPHVNGYRVFYYDPFEGVTDTSEPSRFSWAPYIEKWQADFDAKFQARIDELINDDPGAPT